MKIMNPDLVLPIEVLTKNASIIDLYPLDVVQKTGKYQFIYDYEFGGLQVMCITTPCNSGFASTKFSKGDVVSVIRFEGNNPIIENPNYKEPAPDAPKISSWASSWDSLIERTKQKEFSIPQEYLQKVDDSATITIQTGINYGANLITQPVSVSFENPIFQGSYIEENATFVLTKDFEYESGTKLINDGIKSGTIPVFSTLKSGTKVSGKLFSKFIKGFSGGVYSSYTPDTENKFLQVKGYGNQGSIEIPIEYLTREIVSVISLVDKKTGKCNETGLIQTMDYNPCRVSAVKGETYKGYIAGGSFYTIDGKTFIPINEYKIIKENNGAVVPVANDNKNLLIIVGAFLLGYALFSNGKSSN